MIHRRIALDPSRVITYPFTNLSSIMFLKERLPQEPLLPTWINFDPAWISNYIHYEMWNEITYPLPNFNGCTVEVWELVSSFNPDFTGHLTHYNGFDYLSMMRVKLIDVNKRGSRWEDIAARDVATCIPKKITYEHIESHKLTFLTPLVLRLEYFRLLKPWPL